MLAAATPVEHVPRSLTARPPRRPAGRAFRRAEAAALARRSRRRSQPVPVLPRRAVHRRPARRPSTSRGSSGRSPPATWSGRPGRSSRRTCSAIRARESVRSRCSASVPASTTPWSSRRSPSADCSAIATERVLAPGRQLSCPETAPAGKAVALVGGGPASLACAGTLALEGVEAVIYERARLGGGLNTLGIAPYKMPRRGRPQRGRVRRVARRAPRTGVEVGEDTAGGPPARGVRRRVPRYRPGWRHSAAGAGRGRARASWGPPRLSSA